MICHHKYDSVKLMDPDGQEVVIWYDDDHGKRQSFNFSGFHGQKSITIPKNQYVRDFIQAYLYNARNGGGQKTIQAVTNPKYKIHVRDTYEAGSYYKLCVNYYDNDDLQPTVNWKPRTGLITSEDGRLSPATILEHEMDHAVFDIDCHFEHDKRYDQEDIQYDNMEERRVITGNERKTAQGNKEAIRKNHIGKSYKTVSSTSTEPLK